MGGGKVVINITVNQFGDVIDASYNSAASNSKNGCLIDNALIYAQKAQFTPSGKVQQLGTITYMFQDK